LSGAAAGTINVLNATLTGIIGYTSGTFALNGLLFNPSISVPSGVTISTLISSNSTVSIGGTTGGFITNMYGNYVEMRNVAGGPTITNTHGYGSSPAWRNAQTLVSAYRAFKAILSAYGTGPVTDVVAFEVDTGFGATANATNWSGLRIPNITGPGTIWGLNITGTMNNRLAGKLLVGATSSGFAPDQALEIVGIIEARNSAATRYRGDFNPTGTDLVIYAFDDTGAVELPVSFGLNRYVQIDPTRIRLNNNYPIRFKTFTGVEKDVLNMGTDDSVALAAPAGKNLLLRADAGVQEINFTAAGVWDMNFTTGVNLSNGVGTAGDVYTSRGAGLNGEWKSVPTLAGNFYASGSFTLVDGQFRVHVKQLRLTGSQRLTMQGDSRLVIMN
jgi:hypothetical protein